MKILQERGFFGAGLVPVTTPLLVDRYNDCLKAIGKEPTERKRFAIDGAGWSPQIAAERKDPNYLCHGEANLYAILLTPDQKGKPVYMPMHSFDWKILDIVHSDHRKAVHNLTGVGGVILDIDQGIDSYHSPFDLLMLHSILVKASTPNRIMRKAAEQRELVARFRHEEDAYANCVLVEKLVESARQNGDLRHRALDLPDVPFDEVSNFYTRAMGGVFVFRKSPKRDKPILVSESGDMAIDPGGNHNLYSLKEEPSAVLKVLEQAGLVRRLTGLAADERNRRLSTVLHSLQAGAIYASGFGEDLSDLTDAQRKGALVSAQEFLPDFYKELYDLQRLTGIDRSPKLHLSTAACEATLTPAPGLDPLTTDVVWQLLCQIHPLDLEMTFRHSKEHFYRLYQKWGPGQRKWAIRLLESKGLPQLDRY